MPWVSMVMMEKLALLDLLALLVPPERKVLLGRRDQLEKLDNLAKMEKQEDLEHLELEDCLD